MIDDWVQIKCGLAGYIVRQESYHAILLGCPKPIIDSSPYITLWKTNPGGTVHMTKTPFRYISILGTLVSSDDFEKVDAEFIASSLGCTEDYFHEGMLDVYNTRILDSIKEYLTSEKYADMKGFTERMNVHVG